MSKSRTAKRDANIASVLHEFSSVVMNGETGGASRDRTDDLRVANATLSQLSYGPVRLNLCSTRPWILELVGLGGVEPPTSPLSGVRSNQLSYRPGGQRRVALKRAYQPTKHKNR